MEWQFALYLFAAMILSVPLTWLQTRRYTRAVREMAAAHDDRSKILVSGRGRGKLRGSVAMLVIDAADRTIVEARVMAGASVFARIRRAHELEGPLDDAASRAGDRMTAKALIQATEQFETVLGSRRTGSKRVIARTA
ncbi:GutM domain-containing protein [Acidipropionibacterium acidipropionici ATCC 4875]|uniref:GutM domain-containing protein n=1 Tax=Acidipropionibacterium acidipropionici (strain ATCC 4875 / DSM 20272 / JCM 6432 / NBRC 12425 / NCIMB 8070 / 4) TaxID=1171373 RepID=K7RL63_ACIA4|nr:transcriptional regulator GutM [Acidipropionibacterium acidipropionici]AFV88659.1 GutM domain-containing protein [Acidipropionibacterium acidipropionici ATCC 4875]